MLTHDGLHDGLRYDPSYVLASADVGLSKSMTGMTHYSINPDVEKIKYLLMNKVLYVFSVLISIWDNPSYPSYPS